MATGGILNGFLENIFHTTKDTSTGEFQRKRTEQLRRWDDGFWHQPFSPWHLYSRISVDWYLQHLLDVGWMGEHKQPYNWGTPCCSMIIHAYVNPSALVLTKAHMAPIKGICNLVQKSTAIHVLACNWGLVHTIVSEHPWNCTSQQLHSQNAQNTFFELHVLLRKVILLHFATGKCQTKSPFGYGSKAFGFGMILVNFGTSKMEASC